MDVPPNATRTSSETLSDSTLPDGRSSRTAQSPFPPRDVILLTPYIVSLASCPAPEYSRAVLDMLKTDRFETSGEAMVAVFKLLAERSRENLDKSQGVEARSNMIEFRGLCVA